LCRWFDSAPGHQNKKKPARNGGLFYCLASRSCGGVIDLGLMWDEQQGSGNAVDVGIKGNQQQKKDLGRITQKQPKIAQYLARFGRE